MRIISGKYKRRNIKYIKNDYTRPTIDKVREAIFNIITPYLLYDNCLDLFAGTGSLGLEALSRGYNKCYFIDNNYEAIKTIKENLDILNEKDGLVIKNDYNQALNYFKRHNIKFDLIFLDPPYKLNILNNIIDKLIEFDLLKDNAIIVLEHLNENRILNDNFKIIKEVSYGIMTVTILKKE